MFIAPEPEVNDAEIFHNPEDALDHFEGDTTTTGPLLDLCKKRIATLPAVRGQVRNETTTNRLEDDVGAPGGAPDVSGEGLDGGVADGPPPEGGLSRVPVGVFAGLGPLPCRQDGGPVHVSGPDDAGGATWRGTSRPWVVRISGGGGGGCSHLGGGGVSVASARLETRGRAGRGCVLGRSPSGGRAGIASGSGGRTRERDGGGSDSGSGVRVRKRPITVRLSFRFDSAVELVDVRGLRGPGRAVAPVSMTSEQGLGAGSDVRDAGSGVRAGSIWRWDAVASHG